MTKPKLIIIAGSPGSGKSTFSKLFEDDIFIYNYDEVFKKECNLIFPPFPKDDIIKEAHKRTSKYLELEVKKSIEFKKDFCFETNLEEPVISFPNNDKLSIAEYCKKIDYRIELHFLCLDSKEKAKERVYCRDKKTDYSIPKNRVDNRYKLGFQNLNKYWTFFDSIKLYETSKYFPNLGNYFLKIENGKLTFINDFPDYLKSLIPNIEKLVI